MGSILSQAKRCYQVQTAQAETKFLKTGEPTKTQVQAVFIDEEGTMLFLPPIFGRIRLMRCGRDGFEGCFFYRHKIGEHGQQFDCFVSRCPSLVTLQYKIF